MTENRNVRIVVVGDDLVAGSGDPRALGWIGRVMARTRTLYKDPRVDVFPLAVLNENTAKLLERWEKESEARFDERTENRVIIGLGHADIVQDVPIARSRLHLANILDQAATKNVIPLVIGPPPKTDAATNKKIAHYSDTLSAAAARRNVLYVDMFTPLVTHEQWRTDLAAGQGLPGQAGYGLMAWLVLHRGWYHWMNLPEPTQ